MAIGHFLMASERMFFLALMFLIAGNGCFKPNISTQVGLLYKPGDPRRDGAFTIFYMGINLGAFFSPLVCGTLGQTVGWHWGFGAAGVGMVLGLIQYRLSKQSLGNSGLHPGQEKPLNGLERTGLFCGVAAVLLPVGLSITGAVRINPVMLARGAKYVIAAMAAIYFICVLLFFGLDQAEKRRVGVIVVLFAAAVLFWTGFEQVGSSFNLFADRYTARHLGWFNYDVPAGWFQSLGPIFVITLAPVMAAVWVRLARRNLDPLIPVKFGLGLLLLAAGFLAMTAAARLVAAGHKVWPTWLISTYLLHTLGELCLSPVGLSSVTKLAPRRLVGQMMGTWFLAASLGNLIAGLIAGGFSADAVEQMPARYFQIVIPPAAAGVLLILLAKPVKRWMAGIR
jgi:POT family proton-dependent oligopeptide transporter